MKRWHEEAGRDILRAHRRRCPSDSGSRRGSSSCPRRVPSIRALRARPSATDRARWRGQYGPRNDVAAEKAVAVWPDQKLPRASLLIRSSGDALVVDDRCVTADGGLRDLRRRPARAAPTPSQIVRSSSQAASFPRVTHEGSPRAARPGARRRRCPRRCAPPASGSRARGDRAHSCSRAARTKREGMAAATAR